MGIIQVTNITFRADLSGLWTTGLLYGMCVPSIFPFLAP